MASKQEIAQIFADIASNLDPAMTDDLNATIQFDLDGDNGGLYWVKVGDGEVLSGTGPANKPEMTLRALADDWAAVVSGELNPMQAFMSGRLKIRGNMDLALKLQALFESADGASRQDPGPG